MVTWHITNLHRDPETGFVLSVDWMAKITGVDKECSISDRCNFVFDGEVPISYLSLTENIVLGWVFNEVDRTQVEASLAHKLEKATASGMPWTQK